MCVLAQTVEVFYTAYGSAAVEKVARVRSGRWFDPDLLGVLIAEARRTVAKPAARGLEARDSASKTCEARLLVTLERVDLISRAFAEIKKHQRQ